MDMRQLGWVNFFDGPFQPFKEAGLEPARVVSSHRAGCKIVCAHGELPAEVTGRFRFDTPLPADFPTVGDWLAVEVFPAESKAMIHAVLPRRTRPSRPSSCTASMKPTLRPASHSCATNWRPRDAYRYSARSSH